MNAMRLVPIAGLSALAVAALVAVGGWTEPAGAAQPPGLSVSDNALAARVAGKVMTAPGRSEAARAKGKELVSAFFPGEKPWGDLTSTIETHDILLVRTTENLRSDNFIVPPGTPSLGKPKAVMVFYDVQSGEEVGVWAMFNDSDTTKGSLSRLYTSAPQSARGTVSVPAAEIERSVS